MSNNARSVATCAAMLLLWAANANAQGGAAAAVAAATAPAPAPELGKLFFSAPEREQLERERNRERPPAAAEIAGPQKVIVSGLISGPGGTPIPVINGRVLAPGQDLSGLKITGLADGRVRITRSDGKSSLAKPGQTVDLSTGEVGEIYDLPGRRGSVTREAGLPVTFGSGFAERAAAEAKVKAIKAKRPRRAGGRGKAGSGPKPATPAKPAVAKPAAPGGPILPPPMAAPDPRR